MRLCRCEQAEELCRQRETALAEARAEAEALRGALDAERAAADAAAAALRGSLEQRHAADIATALGDANGWLQTAAACAERAA